MKHLITGCCVLLLSGCASQYDYQTPIAPTVEEHLYTYQAFTPDLWLSFGAKDLEALLTQAFAHNWDLAIAAERLRVAQLAIQIQQAGNSVSASVSASSARNATLNNLDHSTHSESLSFSARYEWDLWGKLQAQLDQTELSAQTTQWDLDAARVTVTANIVTQYLAYLALKERRLIADKNLQSARDSLALYDLQHEAGVVSRSDLLKQQSTILSLEEKLETLTLQQYDLRRALALLSGQADWNEQAPELLLTDLDLPRVALNQPAELIRQRPDLKAAEAAVRSAYLNKVETELDRWPNLSISLSLRPSDFYDLAEQWAVSLSESISMSLYDAGERSLSVQQAEIQETISRIDYEQTVRTALQEVQDALSDYQQSVISYRYQQASYDNLSEQTQIIEYEWEEGISTKSDLISAQRSLFNAEESLVTAQQSVLNSITRLYQANGSAPIL